MTQDFLYKKILLLTRQKYFIPRFGSLKKVD